MKINVPLFQQDSKMNCGPVALKMILDYFEMDLSVNDISKVAGIIEGKGIMTIQLAYAAAHFGRKVEFYSNNFEFNPENLKEDFYKKFSDLGFNSEEWIAKAKNVNVYVEEKTFDLNQVLKFIDDDYVPLILLDWNVVKGQEGYKGHFVVLVGYDHDLVFINDPGLGQCVRIKKEVFDKARKAKGTDQDIILIR